MWSIMYKGLQKNLIMAIIFLMGFAYLFTTTVATADLEKLQKQQEEKFEKLEKKSDTLDEKIDKMAVGIATIVAEWKGFALKESGGQKESFNHVIDRWPPAQYLVGWEGRPPTTRGWDSVKVANFVKVGHSRPLAICFYTDPAGLVKITELE